MGLPGARLLKPLLLVAALGTLAACHRTDRRESIRTHVIHSRFLSKDMTISVLLPPGYSSSRRYGVLYLSLIHI